jgi:short-subunit dehydrogenase
VAIVSGASSGIGRATARELGARGAAVVLTARNGRALQEVASEITRAGGSATVIVADMTVPEQVRELVRSVVATLGRIDIVVANAGLYVRGPAATLTTAEYERSMAINFFGSLELIYAALPHMLGRGRGHIVAVTSVDGKKGLPLDAPYAAAKGALTMTLDVLRQELRPTGVGVSTVLPGRVDTPMIRDITVPWISPKISPARVARAIVRAIERNRAEVIVPWLGPKFLLVAAALAAPAGDFFVRMFHLEGESGSS